MFNSNRVRASINSRASLPPAPITSVQQLKDMGYVCKHVPAGWKDDGDAENGPCLSGHDEYNEWTKGQQFYIVQHGAIIANGINPPEFEDMPF